jgi:hypothetical protein
MAKPKTPAGLGTAAKFWREVTATYELRVDELRILEDACREMNLIDRIQKEVDSDRLLTSKGSMGQEVASPMVQELRHHRTTLARLLTQLQLPSEESGSPAQSRSSAGRALAASRWHGKAS